MADKRKRSPKFPYVGMNEGEQILKNFFGQHGENYVPIILAYTSLGMNPKSSSTNRIISSLLDYGVLEDEGANEDKRLKISNVGIRLIKESREPNKLELKRKIVLSDEMMNTAFGKFKQVLPNENTMSSVLELDLGFTDRAATRFIKVIRDNYAYAELNKYNPLVREGNNNQEHDEEPPQPKESKDEKDNPKPVNDEKDDPGSLSNGNLLEFPIPVDGGRQFAYLKIPQKLSRKDAEIIQSAAKMYSEYFIKDNDEIPF